jgi:two-component system, OmpR family, response regulator VicR
MKSKILLIEDNITTHKMLYNVMTDESFDVFSAYFGADAISLVKKNHFDLVLLDLGLPDVEGQYVIRAIREVTSVPIIIISSKSRDVDKVSLLSQGADDYLVKPFSMIELIARVNANLRRSKMMPESRNVKLRIGNISLDLLNHCVIKNDEKIKLTRNEVDILQLFITRTNKVITKKELFETVWKTDYIGNDNVLNVNIRRIREKIELDPSNPKVITSIWGVGYIFNDIH